MATDELPAAGLETEIDVEDVDAEDFYPDPEDDYDPGDWYDRRGPDESELPFR